MNPRHPLFFVVSGAHGVGKTTAIRACHTLLSDLGISVRQFHHIVDVVPSKQASGVSRVDVAPRTSRSALYWGRFVPRPLKMVVANIHDGLVYARGINRILVQAEAGGQIALSDRYVYDRMIDLRLLRRPPIQRAVVSILCRFMRRPTTTILLTDSPAAIYRRKQEQTEAGIDEYQRGIVDLCNRVRAPLQILPVNNSAPDAVARDLAAAILRKARDLGHPISSTAGAASFEKRVGDAGCCVAGES